MNPKAKKLHFNRCEVCGYPYSDMHHIYPRRLGGMATIALCPNHHRAANFMQNMIEAWVQDGQDSIVWKMMHDYASKHFDAQFNSIVAFLAQEYLDEECRTVDRIYGYGN